MATTQELQAKADALREQLAAAEAEAAASETGDAEPKSEAEALDQLLEAIISHCGNHPRLEAKLEKLRSFQSPPADSGQPEIGGASEAATS